MNTHVLVLQATYTNVEYALYSNQHMVLKKHIIKNSVCTDLMFELCHMLEKMKLTWENISHIIVNQGPAPFTTLRALIATVNGIAFAQKIPLIAVDGLAAFTEEIAQKSNYFLILLNAFAGDFYYSLCTNRQEMGCASTATIINLISNNTSPLQPLKVVGNGVPLLSQELVSFATCIVQDLSYEYVSLERIAHIGFEKISQSSYTFSISPLYLKALSYKPSCNI